MEQLDDVLKHFGTKGMRWGVRRSGKGQNGNKKPRQPSKLKQELSSMKRERHWKKTLSKAGSMSTKEINRTVTRIQRENDLKKLSRNKRIGSDKDKKDYLNRAKMDDQVLARKVNRLRAKENLDRAVKEASKEQMALGKEIVTFVMKAAMEAKD